MKRSTKRLRMVRGMPLQPGHRLGLLSGGDAMFAAMTQAVDRATRSVHLETYILQLDGAPLQVVEALERAAKRGLSVRLMVDGVGTGLLPKEWQTRLTEAGVQVRVYAPLGGLGLLIPSRWRRLHRKLCVVDGVLGFCGGINLLDDRIAWPDAPLAYPRVDFALCCTGPLVAWMDETMAQLWWRAELAEEARRSAFKDAWATWRARGTAATPLEPAWLAEWWHSVQPGVTVDDAMARLVLRDNIWHRRDIERAYLLALERAQHSVVMAHAYFVPSGAMLRALKAAAARGVRVRVLLQGRYEGFMQHHAARPLYRNLLRAGLDLREYTTSDLHAKVAVVDDSWATVGSSNLDPLSLLLAREANIVTTERRLVAELAQRIGHLLDHDAIPLDAAALQNRPIHQRLLDRVAYLLMRVALFLAGKRY